MVVNIPNLLPYIYIFKNKKQMFLSMNVYGF